MSAEETAADRVAVRSATLVAALMIAQQTASKATRDALFLTNFPVSWLPTMLIGAAVASIAMVLLSTRLMRRLGPIRLVTPAFFLSAGILAGLAALQQVSAGAAAILLYLHIAAMGAVVISAFWALVTERFDPRAAKRHMSRIAAGATGGGLVGGLLAERLAALGTGSLMLLVLSGLHIVCGVLIRAVTKGMDAGPRTGAGSPTEQQSSLGILKNNRHLLNLGLLLLAINTMATLVDYSFKEQASAAYTSEAELLRFFALFYTGLGVATFVLQSFGSRLALEHLGLSGTVALLPGLVAFGSLTSIFVPGLFTSGLTRGTESTLRSSLFRSGYELFYTPISAEEKRATKTIIDVGFDRAGDIAGSLAVLAVLLFPASMVAGGLAIATIILAGVALYIARELHKGYVASLERGLLDRAVQLDVGDIQDKTTRSLVLNTMQGSELSAALAAARQSAQTASAQADVLTSQALLSALDLPFDLTPNHDPAPATDKLPAMPANPIDAARDALRSGDELRTQTALRSPAMPELVDDVVDLLAWDAVSQAAGTALQPIAAEVTPRLVARLLDPDEEFTVRRRLPIVIRHGDPELALDGLLRSLEDRRFEVRYRSGVALLKIHGDHPKLLADAQRVETAVLRELKVGRRIWDGRRLLDSEDATHDELSGLSQSRSLEHVFRLLSLRPPGRPLRVAYRGLQTTDKTLRGTALEYLETVLEDPIRSALWPFLDVDESSAKQAPKPPESRANLEAELLKSQATIDVNLALVREQLKQRYAANTLDEPSS